MTVSPLPVARSEDGLRVLSGRRFRPPSVAPWMIVVLVAVLAFLGLGFARTSLDRSAFELAELNESIAEQSALNHQLSLEIARLENPARIAPLAENLGLVIPDQTNPLLVDLAPEPRVIAEGDTGANQ